MEKIDKMKSMFGKYTDREIADAVGVSRQRVSNYRLSQGIDVFRKWERYEKLLGTKPDNEIADLMGITANAVTQKRNRMGIEPFVEHNQNERKFQERFVKTLDNPKEYVITDRGILDVETENALYELKVVINLSALQRALGQIMLYGSAIPNKKLYIVCQKLKIEDALVKDVEKLGVKIITFSQ
jgi:predicted transcriptional regulator